MAKNKDEIVWEIRNFVANSRESNDRHNWYVGMV